MIDSPPTEISDRFNKSYLQVLDLSQLPGMNIDDPQDP
jgi:hypothetical protein